MSYEHSSQDSTPLGPLSPLGESPRLSEMLEPIELDTNSQQLWESRRKEEESRATQSIDSSSGEIFTDVFHIIFIRLLWKYFEALTPVPLFLVLGAESYKIGASYLESRIAHLSGLDPQGHFPKLRMDAHGACVAFCWFADLL